MDAFLEQMARFAARPLMTRGRTVASFLHDVESREGGWVERLTSTLAEYLPRDFLEARSILLADLGPERTAETAMPDAHAYSPWIYFIAQKGAAHMDASMDAFASLGKRSYMTYAGARYWFQRDWQQMLTQTRRWAQDESPHLRRLATNTIRSPYAYGAIPTPRTLAAFKNRPEIVLDLLDHLHADPSPMVRKAVAGNLKALAKAHGQSTFQRIQGWLGQQQPGTRQVVRPALQWGQKMGNPLAKQLLAAAG